MSGKKSLSADWIYLGKPINIPIPEEEEPTPKIRIDYKKETTFFFYNAMLKNIVKKWDVTIEDTTESIPSGDEVICSKPYEPCPRESIEIEEELSTEIQDTPARKASLRTSIVQGTESGKKRSSSRHSTFESTSAIDVRKHKKVPRGSTIKFKLKRVKSKTIQRLSKYQPLGVVPVIVKKEEPTHNDWILKGEKEIAEITFANGNRYIGELFNKIMHGTGRMIWPNGTTYTGDFENGQMTGKCHIEFPDKSVYDGEIYKGYMHGRGNENKYYEDSHYNGEYHLGSKHGEGRMMFGINNYYDGPWKMNTREGKGLRHYANGAKYYGDWVNGKRHGFGTILMTNDFYHGDWSNGEKHGYGEYVWNAFLNNDLSIPVQNKYCGLWEHDCMHGFGLLYFGVEGGARYAGSFYKNIKHGPGIIVCNDGRLIKADPLFVNDKPVRVIRGNSNSKSHSSAKSSSSNNESVGNLEPDSLKNSCTDLTCSNLEPKIHPILSQHKLKPHNFPTINNFIFPCYGLEKGTISKLNQYKLIYPNDVSIECVPNSIDLGCCELVDLSKVIDEVAAKYSEVVNSTDNKENISSIKARYFKELKVWPCLVSEHFCEDYVFERFNKFKECDNFHIMEDNRIRKAIKQNLRYLFDLYDNYAFVACFHERPKYKPWMMRICFWQLFMDCKFSHKNITINEFDAMMAEHSPITVDDIHNPFDVIYFWQFLTGLIILAWKLYGNEFVNIQCNGILEKTFEKFLVTDIFPNATRHKGSALFDYRDVIPITAAFEWFKSFGPDFTAFKFLKYSSSINRIPPPGYFQDIGVKISPIQYGENVAFISDKILYREVKSYVINNKKMNYPTINAKKNGYYLKSLKFLYLLGSKKVLAILKEICPMIAVQDEYINMNHKLSFLEFYEAILQCTQQQVIEADEYLDIADTKTVFTCCRSPKKRESDPKKDERNLSRSKTA